MIISAKTPRETILKLTGECKKCGHCCSHGSGVLAEEDFGKISKFLRIREEQLRDNFLETIEKFNTTRHRPRLIREGRNPYGSCVFLEGSECSIHQVKPLQCRMSSCNMNGADIQKWFDLKFFLNKRDPESIRQYATYLAFNPPLPGASLLDLVPDKAELDKILNYEKLK